MKIIGTTESGYILESSADEVANLIGYYSKYSTGLSRPAVGETIRVHEMYTYLRNLTMAAKEMENITKKLQNAAELTASVIIPIKMELE